MNPAVRGVPFGRRSPLQRGPYSTPIHTWLRDVANRRVHATTGRVPAELLMEERGTLLPLAAPWDGEVLRPPTARPLPTRRPAPVIQHPLSVYEGLLGGLAS